MLSRGRWLCRPARSWKLAAPLARGNHEEVRDGNRTTHFGYKSIRESEKTKEVYTVFEKVASNYDVMNDLMSGGVHRVWKDILMERLSPTHGCRLLDSAGGTGDITFRYVNYLKSSPNPLGRKSHVTVCDINDNMLQVGEQRYRRLGFDRETDVEVGFKQCNAEKLSFDDNSFNAYTIAFGIRNVTHIDKALSEAYRVLTPGGRFLCLEFSHVGNDVLREIYNWYSFQLIPVMGTLVTGEWQPYQYLVESIRKFPNQEDFKGMIEAAGFRDVKYENLTCGVVAIHSAFKI